MSPYFIKSFEYNQTLEKIYIVVEDANTGDWWKYEITPDSLLSLIKQAARISSGNNATKSEKEAKEEKNNESTITNT